MTGVKGTMLTVLLLAVVAPMRSSAQQPAKGGYITA